MSEKIKVLIVDDHHMFADGIKSLLRSEKDIEVIGMAHDGESALEKMKSLAPDVVLLDIGLPDIDGLEVCSRATAEIPGSKLIGLSMHEEEAFITGLLERGARGYLLKSAQRQELCDAIRSVQNGQQFYSKQVTQTLIDELLRKQRGITHKAEEEKIELSEREREVLQLIVDEYTTKEIGEKLFISHNTVDTHRRRLLEKLGARNTAGLVRIALEKGLLSS